MFVMTDFPLQSIITRDNVEIHVHPMILYRIVSPIKVAYEVYDISHAVEKLVQTTLRSIIGDMGLDDTLASREEINRLLNIKISQVCLNWGIELKKVEILEIVPGPSIQQAMHKQIAAERIRRAAIISADGFREMTKTEAEGECQSVIAISKGEQRVSILRATGYSEAKVIMATAEAQALTTISESLSHYGIDPTQYMVGLKYIETLSNLALRATKRVVYFPFETSISGALKEVTAGL
eukprot:TRINITY_DN24_c0_g1_i2.p1 TRINITY_DN24_c0_g1~~TRINITY_DN24_c0_g1_i2.p1  ORF type:complete len:238 (-),score=76.26 TRINITY_DN24_c0_g1_i2:267-980(-)